MGKELTPMLKQYMEIKAKYKDCILFYRLGDFYEMFFDDAKEASAILDLVLTSRGKGTASKTPMCGIPYHAAENYIAKLVKANKKIAICEQVEDPGESKGIVKRDVVRVITSGTYIDESNTSPRFLICLTIEKNGIGFSFIDPASGTISTNQSTSLSDVIHVIAKQPIYECVYPISQKQKIDALFNDPLIRNKMITMSPSDDWCFNAEMAKNALCEHFKTNSLRGYGIEDMHLSVAASGALLEYLKMMNNQPMRHVDKISVYSDTDYAFISPAAFYGLEMETLRKTLDKTISPLGKRMFRHWLYHPLKNTTPIKARQHAVEILLNRDNVRNDLRTILKSMPDIEKHLSRISCGYTNPRDLLALRNGLSIIPEINALLDELALENPLFQVKDEEQIRTLLERAVNPDMPLSKNEGKVIASGYDEELDAYKDLQQNGKDALSGLQKQEIEKTGINSLKIGFNKVFGYYIEISKTNQSLVPEHYIRKQTLVNAERYIIPELKEFEEKMLSADAKVAAIEDRIIHELCSSILDYSESLHYLSTAIATVDTLASLAELASKGDHIRPVIDDGMTIDIKDGRHPVVEYFSDDTFIPNDTLMDTKDNHLLIITGPNMAGKSTYIRQTAVIVIMAQMGAFIPAKDAQIGIVDKIFTRIGAHDEISKGQSTFMVEMSETAGILNNLSERSLVILDEIGRGTSTFDGLSLAWSIAEYLQKQRVRTLFATHFHEITVLEDELPGVKNYNISVKEWQDEITFLHKIVRGAADDSYGIYVAKLAGIPKQVVMRANTILQKLESNENLHERVITAKKVAESSQLTFFGEPESSTVSIPQELLDLEQAIGDIDPNNMTPIQALNKLLELKEMVSENVAR